MSATDDPEVARAWYISLRPTGVGGVVAKLASAPYRVGRSSSRNEARHADTVDTEVVGFSGSPSRARALAVCLPDGRTALSQRLGVPLAAQAAVCLTGAPKGGRDGPTAGDAYVAVELSLTVEVLAGTTRHAVVTGTRLR